MGEDQSNGPIALGWPTREANSTFNTKFNGNPPPSAVVALNDSKSRDKQDTKVNRLHGLFEEQRRLQAGQRETGQQTSNGELGLLDG
ncbi:hypothetical protein AVEN_269792-1 [Araneus ventricosus]|uniref:Uncharacterized protein n=1 Tax=Araneus ventricosus TaxID=182803 RepID=A0A4Y2PDM4_ARAVE|nr:hypothetical protein AVEN_269792-1 [Araneus ventricosus]